MATISCARAYNEEYKPSSISSKSDLLWLHVELHGRLLDLWEVHAEVHDVLYDA